MSITEKKLRQQIAKALYVGKRTRASIPGLPVWDWEPAWLQDEYLQQSDDVIALIAEVRTAALEEAAGIAERRRPEIGPHILDTPYRRGLHDGGTRTAESIRAAAVTQ